MVAVLAMFAFTGCSKGGGEDEIPEPQPETYLVSFSFAGDIDVSQEPLSRGTATNDLYGINVYFGTTSPTTLYAHGLFDNLEDMTIPLIVGNKYKFECTLVRDGKTKLYYGTAFGKSYLGYCFPFHTGTNSSPVPTILKNEFILGSDTELVGIGSGTSHMAGTTPSTSNYVDMPNTDRYYGVLTDYTPTENGQVVIDLKRTVFGVKTIYKGIHEGATLEQTNGFGSTTITGDMEESDIYTFSDVRSASSTRTIEWEYRVPGWDKTWTKKQSITFMRNTMTTITVDLGLFHGDMNFTEEAPEDNYIDLEVNGGVIDTPVVPEE